MDPLVIGLPTDWLQPANREGGRGRAVNSRGGTGRGHNCIAVRCGQPSLDGVEAWCPGLDQHGVLHEVMDLPGRTRERQWPGPMPRVAIVPRLPMASRGTSPSAMFRGARAGTAIAGSLASFPKGARRPGESLRRRRAGVHRVRRLRAPAWATPTKTRGSRRWRSPLPSGRSRGRYWDRGERPRTGRTRWHGEPRPQRGRHRSR